MNIINSFIVIISFCAGQGAEKLDVFC